MFERYRSQGIDVQRQKIELCSNDGNDAAAQSNTIERIIYWKSKENWHKGIKNKKEHKRAKGLDYSKYLAKLFYIKNADVLFQSRKARSW